MNYMTIDEIKQSINNEELKEGTILFPRTYNEDVGFYIVYNDSIFYNQAKSIVEIKDFKEDEIFRVKVYESRV